MIDIFEKDYCILCNKKMITSERYDDDNYTISCEVFSSIKSNYPRSHYRILHSERYNCQSVVIDKYEIYSWEPGKYNGAELLISNIHLYENVKKIFNLPKLILNSKTDFNKILNKINTMINLS